MINIKELKSAVILDDASREKALERRFHVAPNGERRIISAGRASPASDQRQILRPEAEDGIDVDRLRALCAARNLPWQEEYTSRIVRFVGSTEQVDSYGDIVLQNFDFSRWDANAPMPKSHNIFGDPLGQHIEWSVQKIKLPGYSGPALITLGLFAPADANPEAESTRRLIRLGFLRGSSIGFNPQIVIDVKDPDERAKLGLGRWGFIYDQNLLFELSPCMIGACPGTSVGVVSTQLGAAIKAHHVEARDVGVYREMLRLATHIGNDDWRAQDAAIADMARMLFGGTERSHFAAAKDRDHSLLLPGEARERLLIRVGGVPEQRAAEPPADEPAETEAAPADDVATGIKQLRADFAAFAESVLAALSAITDRLDEMSGAELVEDDEEPPEEDGKEKGVALNNPFLGLFSGVGPKEAQ